MTPVPGSRRNRFLQAINEVAPEYGDIVKPMLAITIFLMFVWGKWFPEIGFEAAMSLMGTSVTLLLLWVWLHVARRRYARQAAEEDQLNSADVDVIDAQR